MISQEDKLNNLHGSIGADKQKIGQIVGKVEGTLEEVNQAKSALE